VARRGPVCACTRACAGAAEVLHTHIHIHTILRILPSAMLILCGVYVHGIKGGGRWVGYILRNAIYILWNGRDLAI